MNLMDLIKSSDGKIFRAEFVKRDGTLRQIVARTDVRKNLTGKGMAYNPVDRGLAVVYDMKKKAYRMINTNTMKSFKCGDVEWRSS